MIQSLINSNRKGWVDALRGLAILLVIYGHCIKGMPEYFVFTSPVKMPLFFAISGYVLKVKDGGTFVNQLFKKVIFPWLFLGLLPSVLMIPFKGISSVLHIFFDMLSGKELWFFPCFIIGEVIHYIIRRFCGKTPLIIITSCMCMAIGLLLHHYDLMSYAMFNRALVVQPFFLAGYLFSLFEGKIVSIQWSWILFALMVYLGLCFFSLYLFPGQTMDVHHNKYYNLPFCLLLIFGGLFILFTTGAKADFGSLIMSFIGQNTLVLYVWHSYAIEILIHGVAFLGWQLPFTWWSALIKVAWACLLCGICSVLLNRYLPFAVGKKKVKNN